MASKPSSRIVLGLPDPEVGLVLVPLAQRPLEFLAQGDLALPNRLRDVVDRAVGEGVRVLQEVCA